LTALLAFDPSTSCFSYKPFYEDERWDALIDQFKKESLMINHLTPQPMLNLVLQAGLTALKTEMCFDNEKKNLNCPCCLDTFGQLCRKLPNSHHVNSSLVCFISGKIMDESNPPLVLPNGYCYSTNVL
jgi:macrophage erythroblast attacher